MKPLNGYSRIVRGVPVALVLLLALMIFMNYADRGNLATASPLIKDELNLNATQMGLLLSAFFWSYTIFCFPAGWLAEHYGPRRVLTAGVAIWSLATLLMGFAGGFGTLFALRVLLGVGESVGYPCCNKLLATELGVDQRGRANGFIVFGQNLGTSCGTWLGGIIMAVHGWRTIFFGFGFASLVWILPWQRLKGGSHAVTERAPSAVHPPLRLILRQRAMWGASIGHFATTYGLYFVTSWLPIYLVKVRGFSMQEMGATAGAAYLAGAFAALAAGWASDRLIRAGISATAVSRGYLGCAHVAKIGCMAGMALGSLPVAIGCLFLNQISSGVNAQAIWTTCQTLAGPRAIGRWMGVQMTFGNVSGIIAPAATGILVDATGGFKSAFAAAAAMYVVGFLAWVVIIPKVEPISWGSDPDLGPSTNAPQIARGNSA